MDRIGSWVARLDKFYLPRWATLVCSDHYFAEELFIIMKNRWLIASSAVGIHICIGSVYAWSVLTRPLMRELGVGLREVQWIFSLAILFLGLSAAFLGSFVEKQGPRKAGLVSAACFSLGLLGSGLAVLWKSLALLYLFYGVVGGIGLGVGYIAPVSTLVKWFPEKRGFATGIAIMGFGFASLIAAPLYQLLLESVGLIAMFEALGLFYLVVMTVSALYLAPPVVPLASAGTAVSFSACGLLARDALKTWQFYTLWWLLFINITCGIGLLSVVSPMAQESLRLSPLAAATMVGLIGLINGAGRFVWASASDYLGRANTYIAFFLIQSFAFFGLAKTDNPLIFQLLVYVIISCYGGGFATVPAFLSDMFGTRELGSIHGKILTAWAAAGVVGPLLVAWIRESTQSYQATLLIFSLCFALSISLAFLLKTKQTCCNTASLG